MIRRFDAWVRSLPHSDLITIGFFALIAWAQFADVVGAR